MVGFRDLDFFFVDSLFMSSNFSSPDSRLMHDTNEDKKKSNRVISMFNVSGVSFELIFWTIWSCSLKGLITRSTDDGQNKNGVIL
jgi:hypothetical protein